MTDTKTPTWAEGKPLPIVDVPAAPATAPEEDTPSAVWRYLGAMFTEQKEGVAAASFTRVLGAVLYLACLVLWVLAAVGVTGEPSSAMVSTLWALVGLKGFEALARGAIEVARTVAGSKEGP